MRLCVKGIRNWASHYASKTYNVSAMTIESEAQMPPAPPPVQDEAVAAIPLISFVIILLMGLGILTLVASYWFNSEAQQITQKHAAEASYPNLERLQVAGMQQLNRYKMLGDGIFQIPVEQAIVRLAREFPEDTRISEEMLP